MAIASLLTKPTSVRHFHECSPMVLYASLLNTQHIRYRSRVKRSNPGKGVVPSPTPRCSRYWKGSLRIDLNYGRQLYFYLRRGVEGVKNKRKHWVYWYIYIYIVTHRPTVSLTHNSSVWLDTSDAWSWDRNPPNFTLDLVSDRSTNKRNA